jgi:hypothetical protein
VVEGGTAVLDCNDDCDGTAVVDECGVCDGNNSSCTDCAGIPNGTAVVDCHNVCGGNGVVTDCGCETASDAITGCCTDGVGPNDEAQDCNSVCGGPGVLDGADACCPSGELDCNDTCREDPGGGCSGGVNASNYTDEATCEAEGYCSDAQYGTMETCTNAIEIWTPFTWTSVWIGDQGGVCSDTEHTIQTACEDAEESWIINGFDCNGVCGGAAAFDCNGVCDGTAVVDECGVCGGDSEFIDNNGSPCTAGSSIDCLLSEDNLSCDCLGNVFDCNGDCGGPAVLVGDDASCCLSGVADNCGICV